MEIEQTKISIVENGTVLESIYSKCPKCSYNFDRGDAKEVIKDIYLQERGVELTDDQAEEIASRYGYTKETPVHFTNIVAVMLSRETDNIGYYECPSCATLWKKENMKEVTIETIKISPDKL